MAKPLNERLASALTDERARLTDLQALLAEVKSERAAQAGIAAQAAADELNFALSPQDRDAAAQRTTSARREVSVLSTAIESLEAKISKRLEAESAKARTAERNAAVAERDALADRIKSEWPEIEACIISLLSDIEASDAKLRSLGIPEASAEAVARGCDPTFKHSGIVPIRRLTGIALPDFFEGTRLAWPIERPSGKHWTDLSEESRRKQVAQMHRRAEAEAADWARYAVSVGTCRVYQTTFMGKMSPHESPTRLEIYSEGLAFGDAALPPEAIHCWLRSGEVSRLRGLGLSVIDAHEPNDEVDDDYLSEAAE